MDEKNMKETVKDDEIKTFRLQNNKVKTEILNIINQNPSIIFKLSNDRLRELMQLYDEDLKRRKSKLNRKKK